MTIAASVLAQAERRLEADNFLSDGYGLRLSLLGKPEGLVSLSHFAEISQPNRLKGVQLPEGHGVPFIAATQAYDYRPIIRKWLSARHVSRLSERLVNSGTILVTCSGTVGRATVATAVHEDTIISHDLLRIVARKPSAGGWVYAWLRAPSVRMMMRSARYGHIIKHLEKSHLEPLPIVIPDEATIARCACELERIIEYRDEAHRLILAAEEQFAAAFPVLEAGVTSIDFIREVSALRQSHGRRLDAAFHNPDVRLIERRLRNRANDWRTIESLGYRVTLPSRFKRIPAENGTPLIGSSQLFEINPDIEKRIAETNFGDPAGGRVAERWLLLARSGQVYGVLGSVTMSSPLLADCIVSDHVIRIIPEKPDVPPGYLQLVMTHPHLGRPRVKALAYGSSIPEIDTADVRLFGVPRLSSQDEQAISDRITRAVELRTEADLAETELGMIAENILFTHLGS